MEEQRHAYSDAAGHYELRVPAGGSMVHGIPIEWAEAPDPNYYPLVNNREIRAPAGTELLEADFQFRRARSIRGKLTDTNRFDVSRLSIAASPAGDDTDPTITSEMTRRNARQTQFEKDGSFRLIQLKPGPYNLLVSSQEVIFKMPIDVSSDRDLADVAITLPPETVARLGIDVRGVVRYADGKPAPKARVELRAKDERTDSQSARAVDDGSFTIPGVDPNHEWTLWLRDAAENSGAALRLSGVEQLTRPLDIALQDGAEFSGTVRDAEGRGLPGYLTMISEPIELQGRTGARSVVIVKADDQGHYRIGGFVAPAGATGYSLSVTTPFVPGRMLAPGPIGRTSVDVRPGTKQSGLDFAVTEQGQRGSIAFKGPQTQPTTRPEAR